MAYHDDLLSQALRLVHDAPQSQASLRRAVSTAYYAVFHLLIAEATANWSHSTLRPELGRAFDHGVMKNASNRFLSKRDLRFAGEDPAVLDRLRFVTGTFGELQEQRHFADYNLTKDLDASEAVGHVQLAGTFFKTWGAIRDQEIAQAYLVSLIVRPR